jgi:hypothetical protein
MEAHYKNRERRLLKLKPVLLFVAMLVYVGSAMASDRLFMVDSDQLRKKQKEALEQHVHGNAVNKSGEKDSQLKMYIRGCGFVTIPKNAKGDIPKANQRIDAVIGSRCSISDWK